MMRRITFITCFVLSIFSSSLTATESVKPVLVDTTRANITKGNWNVGGYFDFTKVSGKDSNPSEWSASISGKYFLMDHLAAGLALGWEDTSTDTAVASLGPAATFFFWNDGRLASYIGMGFRFGLTESTVNSIILTELGLEYFIVPAVAIGPSVFYNHYNGRRSSWARYGVSLNLGVYL